MAPESRVGGVVVSRARTVSVKAFAASACGADRLEVV